MERNEIHMRHLIREFSIELHKELGIIPEYDVSSRSSIPNPIVLKFIKYLRYAHAIGYDEGFCRIAHRKKVHQIKDGKVIATFDSITDAANSVGGDIGAISSMANGKPKYKSHKGYQWGFA